MRYTLALRLVAALAVLAPLASQSAAAQEELQDGPKTMLIQYRANPTNRVAFRGYLANQMAARLQKMKQRGELTDFRIFYSWYRQPSVWDGLVILRFPTFSAVNTWNELEKKTPGGLDLAGQKLGDPVATYLADLSWAKNPDTLINGEVYYVIPYEYRDAGEYREYVKNYVLPQFDGWIANGALTGYELYMNRYSVGTPWDALFIQHYRNMDALGQRQKLTEATRVTLRTNPIWKAWSDRKAQIRSESENTIAELIAH